MRKIIRLTESDLRGMIANSVRKVIGEMTGYPEGNHMLVGGASGSYKEEVTVNIADDLMNKFSDVLAIRDVDDSLEEEWDYVYDFIEENPYEFDISVELYMYYDESTGAGTRESPAWQINRITNADEVREALAGLDVSEEVKDALMEAFDDIVDNMDSILMRHDDLFDD